MVVRAARGGWLGLGALAMAVVAGCQSDCPPGDTSGGGDDTAVDDTAAPMVLTPADCPAYSGFGAVGSSWTYGGTTSTLTFTQSIDRVQNGFVELTTNTLQGSAETTLSSADGRVRYRCATDGLWRLDTSSVTTSTTGEVVAVTHDVRIHDPSAYAQFLPALLEVGTTWQTHHVGTTSDAGGPRRFDNVVTNEVIGVEEVTVPAGTFTTMHIEVTSDGTTRNEWRDATVGLVLGDYLELQAYTP